jgi:hypothetical protein
MIFMRAEPLLRRRPTKLKPKVERGLPIIKSIVSDAQRNGSKAARVALGALSSKARNTEGYKLLEFASRNPLNIKASKFLVTRG